MTKSSPGSEMQDIVHNYEQELAAFRRSMAEFATRFPKIAARLAISGEQVEDIHVERLMQSAALLNARIQARLGDSYPDFTTSLLETIYPEFLRPFPSCTIVAIAPATSSTRITQPTVIGRRSGLTTKLGDFRFETVYDVHLNPLKIEHAAYRPPANVRSGGQLPGGTSGVLSVSFFIKEWLAGGQPGCARVFVDAAQATAVALIDAILLRAAGAFVEADGSGRWKKISDFPVKAAGFDPADAMIERTDGQSQYRLVLEYFALPEKFNFLDFDLTLLARASDAKERLTLHIPVAGVHPESAAGQCLLALASHNFRLSCTPVINLFQSRAEPIALKDSVEPVFNVHPQVTASAGLSIWSVDAVELITQPGNASVTGIESVAPLQSIAHRSTQTGKRPRFWITNDVLANRERYDEEGTFLAFVDESADVMRPEEATQIEADLRCFNGMEPHSWRWGSTAGDFLFTDKSRVGKITALRQPTASEKSASSERMLWTVVTMLSAGPFSLDRAGVPALKELLSAHLPAAGSAKGKQLIDSIVGLSRQSVMEWVVEKPQSRLVRGLRVRLVVDDQLASGHALAIFARVLESVFERFASQNGFVQLAVISGSTGAELHIGETLAGAVPLI